MTYDHGPAKITLSTGRSFYAYLSILGLSIDGELRLFYGSDGDVAEAPRFTQDERREIAQTMIARWREWEAKGRQP